MLVKNIKEAEASLSMSIDSAQSSEEVIITSGGVPAVRLVPVKQRAKRALGFVAGQEHWDNAFFAPL